MVLPGTTCPIFPFKNQLLIELGSSYLKFERHAEFDQDKSEQKYIEKSVHNREMKRGKDRGRSEWGDGLYRKVEDGVWVEGEIEIHEKGLPCWSSG